MAVPEYSGWNDFSKNFYMHLHFVGFEQQYPPMPMRLMFEGESHTSAKVDALLGSRGTINFARLDESFVSALDDPTSYRTLVERLGFEDAFASLRNMHDAVVAKLEGIDSKTIQLAASIDFAEGVLRSDRTWAAVRQGERYLTPTGAPDVDDAAHSFVVTARLRGMPGQHILDADFGSDFPLSRRVLVLVGENGVGKTRLFRALIEGLEVKPEWDAVSTTAETSTFSPRPTFSRLVVFSSAASDSYPTQLPPWGGLDYRFHRMAGNPAAVEDGLAQSLIDCLRLDSAGEEISGVGRLDLLDEILEPLGVKDQLHVEVTASDEGPPRLPTPRRAHGREYLPFFRIKGEQRTLRLQAKMVPTAQLKVFDADGVLRELSSGEHALLRFAIQAVGSLRSGSLLLFDEPETHLHPRYVSKFMSMLDRLLELSGSVALVATHSTYIVREVPARRVRIVGIDEFGEIAIDPPVLQTFGASIDTISQFVFGDISLKHRFQDVLDRWQADSPSATVAEFRERFREDLNAETLSYFAQILSTREAE